MPHIIWRTRMSVGVERIDEDHKQLIRHLNDLDLAINHARYDPKLVARTLLHLFEYTKTHFDREEKLMLAVDYPGYEDHKKLHDTAKKALHDISAEFMQHPTKQAAERIYDFTADWLVHHIVMVDTKLTPYIVGNHPAH
ncbi:bacteriohemerythrin [Azospirillum soli]|uniref:bacteriohemerythrin n=1 Tax=Azospirillum soli TaxID=1304799 RepID=UPI001AE5B0F6|nr:bacteriohemerythrin [Azospirillum soli]MBP2311832.1 hemerythrin [Azospirillum soli]